MDSTQLNNKERLVLAFFLTKLRGELYPFVRMLVSQTKYQLKLKLQNARVRETKKYLTQILEPHEATRVILLSENVWDPFLLRAKNQENPTQPRPKAGCLELS